MTATRAGGPSSVTRSTWRGASSVPVNRSVDSTETMATDTGFPSAVNVAGGAGVPAPLNRGRGRCRSPGP
ncbi:hypothetical protein HD595_007736 [Nonomuraea roseoviolacea subsp. carminata]|uniref:Uncharacterized protein n=1 Tax=Nonomuraea roseoviolacea subsp. carminata TaxID=160689 RepID=A0ABT1KC73_9ACTN|nr:hypothetical protein [Nonomuraea roseoviolacea subsp. carminata]